MASARGAGERPERAPAPSSITTLRAAAVVFFSFPSPRLLGLQLGAALLLRPLAAALCAWDLAIVAAVALYWPLQEWSLHRALLHLRPRRVFGRRVDPIAARYHRAHHREPWRLDFVFLPGRMIAAMIPAHVALWLWLAPTTGLALTGIIAFGGAALLYEWVHYLTHTFYRPRGPLYRAIWRGHRLHHFKSERHWFAFTAPVVDVLLGTAPDPRTLPTSPTCASLGIDDD